MQPTPSVLIVDRSEENREVLTTALARRGIRAFAAARPSRGAEIARRVRPDLIVLDLDQHGSPEQLCGRLSQASGETAVPMVLLATAKMPNACTAGEIVAKPYHYAPLIRKIEGILATGQRKSAA